MFEMIERDELMNTYLIPWSVNIGLGLAIFIAGLLVSKILTATLRKVLTKIGLDELLVNFVSSISHTLLLLIVTIAALDQLGVDTTSLIALLGAAGLAIGLALQGSLQNFASGVLLIIFRPFKTGDYVDISGTSGTVKAINIFSTTLNTPDNKETIVPNGAIYSGVITNYSSQPTRRIDMVFGIGYGDDLAKAKSILEDIMSADERVLKDPAITIAVGELADSSVNFVVRPWVNSADYWGVLFDTTEKVKLTFDREGISIPYPQMDIHMPKEE
ncbi:mechanosensitive ion channel protein MscS [Gammaproteobacteria bacterium 45_16_T64]|nr:mechanosensitive ion channel protein MscS [Gammaproteobacteria bacterium 45_16_T64]